MSQNSKWVAILTSVLIAAVVRGQPQPVGKLKVLKTPHLKPPQVTLKLQGYADLHTHPMSYLGFGRKAMHGAPDINLLIPAGTRDCNAHEFRGRTMADALGHCNSTHGGWGTDNTCGDYIRAAIISRALDDDFKYNVAFERNPHGDHDHAGYPKFNFWPHHTSILHQQMWWEWIKRAHAGGLRVMVALTVNSETLAEILNGDRPYDDKTVADIQIEETLRFVSQHDFMEVAYSSADVRRIVHAGKLAVVLGMEVDKLGNFGKPGVRTDEDAVRAEIQRLHKKGVRYVFPIHLIDNSFGGTAVYETLFNFANRHQNGYLYRVTTNASVGYNAALQPDAPPGGDKSRLDQLHVLLRAVGELPVPCFNDALKCFPPPGKVRCCGSYESIMNILTPTPEFDAYKSIPRGHVNSLGLTQLGEVAIKEMMKLGMLIDIDHMSERAQRSTLRLAQAVPGSYPLVMGHNGLRPPQGTERGAPADVLTSILASGGMLGLGTSDATPSSLASNYRVVAALRVGSAEGPPVGSIALGTDADGFEHLPQNGRPHAGAAELELQSQAFYEDFFKNSRLGGQSLKPDGGAWDYIIDEGVSHYGLMPEFLYDVKKTDGAFHDQLMGSAEYFAEMWAKAETRSALVSTEPRRGIYSFSLPPITNLCPQELVGGDREFGGHGPMVKGQVRLDVSPDGNHLQVGVKFRARETQHDWSQVLGLWVMPIGPPAPAGFRYSRIISDTTSVFEQTLSGGGRSEVFEGCDGAEHIITPPSGPVERIVVVGDTGGGDISDDGNCHCDTRIVRIDFKSIDAMLIPR